MIVYCMFSGVTGKYYFGQTVQSLPDRFRAHLHSATRGKVGRLSSAIREHGMDSFEAHAVAQCASREEMANLERLWILFTRSFDEEVGYNGSYGGKGCGKWTPEMRAAKSLSMAGRKATPAQLEVLSLGREAGRLRPRALLSEEHKQKIRAAHKGKPKSQEHREAVMAAWKLKPRKPNPAQLEALRAGREKMRSARQMNGEVARLA
jgi:hypothetical protein